MIKRIPLLKNLFVTLAGALILAGCVSTSGVVPAGQPGVLMIARAHKGFRGSGALVLAETLKEANTYCQKQGKVMKIVKTVQRDMRPFQSDAQAEVYFKCLSPDDPALKDPTPVVEIRE
jgi:hypothetical protein